MNSFLLILVLVLVTVIKISQQIYITQSRLIFNVFLIQGKILPFFQINPAFGPTVREKKKTIFIWCKRRLPY